MELRKEILLQELRCDETNKKADSKITQILKYSTPYIRIERSFDSKVAPRSHSTPRFLLRFSAFASVLSPLTNRSCKDLGVKSLPFDAHTCMRAQGRSDYMSLMVSSLFAHTVYIVRRNGTGCEGYSLARLYVKDGSVLDIRRYILSAF